jgi:hypothetical protein
MKKKKDFDAVRMMREIRDQHHARYSANPELRERNLLAIRKKYAHKIGPPGTFENE